VQGHPPAATAATAATVGTVDGAYDSKFDNVDLDEILGQERLLNNYIKCLEGLGPCTPDAKMLKGKRSDLCQRKRTLIPLPRPLSADILPDAMTTECVKCTEKQKYGAEKVTRHLIDNRPDDWQRLEQIYDPQGSYRIKYEESKAVTR
ncbi:hypothetical protein KR222_005275, partial [Zaprionus bogoriensis]